MLGTGFGRFDFFRDFSTISEIFREFINFFEIFRALEAKTGQSEARDP